MSARRWVLELERVWDAVRLRRAESGPPADFRIETYLGHGSAEGVVVRGRVLDDPPPSEAVEGEGVGLCVDPGSPEAIAAAVNRLAADPELREQIRCHGLRLSKDRYNWEVESTPLLQRYRSLVPSSPS